MIRRKDILGNCQPSNNNQRQLLLTQTPDLPPGPSLPTPQSLNPLTAIPATAGFYGSGKTGKVTATTSSSVSFSS